MSRTISEIIRFVDDIKPNAFTEEQKTAWLSNLEGRIILELLLQSQEDVLTYTWPEDKDRQVLISPPYDNLYNHYLEAQIDYYNGEYGRYQNAMVLFNSAWGELARWFGRMYDPAQGYKGDIVL